MVEPLSVDTDGVRSLSQIHTKVAAGLEALTSATPGPAAVATSHGTVAHAVQTALAAALGSRSGTMMATQGSGTRISELLKEAAVAYERGDQRSAAAIQAAANAIAAGQGRGADASEAPGGAPGADGAGQVVGQLGQLGQLGQQLGAPLATLGQPLQQLPQQVLQGVQQLAQSAPQSAEAAGTADGQRPGTGAAEPAVGAAPGTERGTGTAPVQSPKSSGADHSRPAD